MIYLVGYAGTLVPILMADMIWLSLMISRLYRPGHADIFLGKIKLRAAIAFYLIYPLG
jgi:uncharacterized membrane protein